MKDGFIKVAAGVPKCTVANVTANTKEIKRLINKADEGKIAELSAKHIRFNRQFYFISPLTRRTYQYTYRRSFLIRL